MANLVAVTRLSLPDPLKFLSPVLSVLKQVFLTFQYRNLSKTSVCGVLEDFALYGNLFLSDAACRFGKILFQKLTSPTFDILALTKSPPFTAGYDSLAFFILNPIFVQKCINIR